MKQHRISERVTVTTLVVVIRTNPWTSHPIGPNQFPGLWEPNVAK